MKIKIITCSYAYNYGAVLQTYALSKYLTDKKNNVEVINYVPNYARAPIAGGIIKRILRKIVRFLDYSKGKKVFGSFLNKYVKLTKDIYTNNEELKLNLPKADVYITGSDQIWNCDLPNGYDDAFFLKFVPDNKIKMSYAASIAMDKLDSKQEERFNKMLKDFNYISVRETTAVKLLEKANIKNAKKVLDPVFLLDKEEWIKLANKETKEKEKYILLYGFKNQKNVIEYAKKIAKEKNCKLYAINTYIEDIFNKKDKYFWNATPEKFVNLIANAEYVVTNSFHGLAMSIILEKQFKVFIKQGGANSRILDLLQELEIKDILEQNKEINYTKVNSKMEELKQKSYQFLNNI